MKKKKNRIAIFDIDGTIFRKNLHFELIDELAWMKVFPWRVRATLTKLYTRWVEHRGTYEEYRRALVDLYAEHINGCRQEDVLKASRIVVPFHKNRTYIFTEQLITTLRKEGYHLVAISGSPLEIVREFNAQHLKFDEVYGTVYEHSSDGVYTGKELFTPTKNKGLVVKQYVYDHQLNLKDSYGIGDTESDASFLKIVSYPIAFNPNQNLKEIAEENSWRIVVEKKDVIYDIQQGNRHE